MFEGLPCVVISYSLPHGLLGGVLHHLEEGKCYMISSNIHYTAKGSPDLTLSSPSYPDLIIPHSDGMVKSLCLYMAQRQTFFFRGVGGGEGPEMIFIASQRY